MNQANPLIKPTLPNVIGLTTIGTLAFVNAKFQTKSLPGEILAVVAFGGAAWLWALGAQKS